MKVIFLLLICWGIVLMVRLSVPYLQMQPGIDFLETKTAVYPVLHWRASFYIHVFTSSFVLAAGLLQFLPVILRRNKTLHRASGYVYCAGILLVSGPASFVMGIYANGGIPARTSFVLLSCLWIFTTARAMVLARNRLWTSHAAWMARSYALTLSALTLRAYALIIGLLNIEIRPTAEYILIAWLSWTVNLLVAEIWIMRRGPEKLLTRTIS